MENFATHSLPPLPSWTPAMDNTFTLPPPPLPSWTPAMDNPVTSTLPPLQPSWTPAMGNPVTLPQPPLQPSWTPAMDNTFTLPQPPLQPSWTPAMDNTFTLPQPPLQPSWTPAMGNTFTLPQPPLPSWTPAMDNPVTSILPPLQPSWTPAMDNTFTLSQPPFPSLVPGGRVHLSGPILTVDLNPNLNPCSKYEPSVCTDPSFGYCTGDQIPGSRSTFPGAGGGSVPKGGSSEGFLAHENTTSYWPREHDVSLPEVSGYGYGYPSWMQPPSLYYAANPHNMSNTSMHVNNGTTPCSISMTSFVHGNPVKHCKLSNASGHIKNATTPGNISEASRSVERSTAPSNILGTSTHVPKALVIPEPYSQLSDSVLGENSGLTFSSKLPHENAGVLDNTFHCGTVLPVPTSSDNRIRFYQSDMKSTETPCGIGRVQTYPHKGTHTSIRKEELIEMRNGQKGEMEAKPNQRARLELFERIRKQNLSMERNAVQYSSSCCSPASGACIPSDTVEAIGSSSLVAKGASLNVMLKRLHNLSDMLYSYFDASELKDHDCELIQLVIDNLGAFAIKNRKNASGGKLDDFSRYSEDAYSSTSGLKSDLVINWNSGSHDMEEEVHCFALDTSNDELDFADNPNSPNLNNDKNVAQAVEKIFQDNFSNNEESFEAKVYKKLWIDAEAALCSLRYELQLAQMKLEAENHNCQPKGELQQSSDVSSLNSMRAHDAYETLVIAKENNPLVALPGSKDKVVTSMMARLKVLKDRDTPNSTGTFQQSSDIQVSSLSSMSDLNEPETPHITKEKNSLEALPTDEGTGFTSVVMARLKILKDRDYTPNPTNADQRSKLANLSGIGDDTFCFQESEINNQSCQIFHEPEISTSTRNIDDELRQGLDASSTDTAQPTSDDEGSNLSSEWEHVTRF